MAVQTAGEARSGAQVAQDLHVLAGKYLTFGLAEGEYGVTVGKVKEIVKVMPITTVPRVPSYLKGVINLRGKVIPVVDLRLKFGLPSREYTERTCIIVVDVVMRGTAVSMGVIVDSVSDVVAVSADELEPPPQFSDSDSSSVYVAALAKVKGVVRIILDLDQVLGADGVARPVWA
jgi:purine-binding chemotaxis protein CheW